jgi:putative transposase
MGVRQILLRASGTTPLRPIQKRSPPGSMPKSIGALMAGFKSATTKRIKICRNLPGTPVWQRNYWDHIIRDDHSYRMITEDIFSNPSKWEEDKLFHGRNS